MTKRNSSKNNKNKKQSKSTSLAKVETEGSPQKTSLKKSPHDKLVGKVLTDPKRAFKFLEKYLPQEFKQIVNLNSIHVEPGAYVEDTLQKRESDIVYKLKTKDNKDAFVFVLCEHQSSNDPTIAFRLWKYTLLLLEKHVNGKKKLPLVATIVFYNGKAKYTAPLSLWEMFENPVQAKELMGDKYRLIDLQSMSNDEIRQDKYLGMFEFFMKNIHMSDKIELWKLFLSEFKEHILIDQENKYFYIKSLWYYTEKKVPIERKEELIKIILDELPDNTGEEVVKSVADTYIDEGYVIGLDEGREEEKIEIASNMLEQDFNLKQIASVTGLSANEIKKLQNSARNSNDKS